jgi:toxin YoeB
MRYDISFDAACDEVIKQWKRSSPSKYKKLQRVVESISVSPREGIGKPEALKGGKGIVWSRRITGHDRIIYEIHDIEVLVLVISIGGHYDDK